MTSLEHESNDTTSASDYVAENWDQENWGEMDVRQKLITFFKQSLY